MYKNLIMKNIILLAAAMTLLAACTNPQDKYAQMSKIEMISVAELQSDDLLLTGTYDELMARQGQPHGKDQWLIPIHLYGEDSDQSKDTLIEIPMTFLSFDHLGYILYGDSIQLYFIDIAASGATLVLQDGKDGLTLNSSTTLEELYYRNYYYEEFVQEGFTIENALHMSPYESGEYMFYIPSAQPFGGIMPNTDLCFDKDKRLIQIHFNYFNRGGIFRIKNVDGVWHCN